MCLHTTEEVVCQLEGKYQGYCADHAKIYVIPELDKKIEKLRVVVAGSQDEKPEAWEELVKTKELKFAILDEIATRVMDEKMKILEEENQRIEQQEKIVFVKESAKKTELTKLYASPFTSADVVYPYFDKLFGFDENGKFTSQNSMKLDFEEAHEFMKKASRAIVGQEKLKDEVYIAVLKYEAERFPSAKN